MEEAKVERKKLLKKPPAFIVDVAVAVAGLLFVDVAVELAVEVAVVDSPDEELSRSLCVVLWLLNVVELLWLWSLLWIR